MQGQGIGTSTPDSGGSGFEGLLADLAASFVNVEPEALDGRIIDAFRDIVLFLGIDRSTLGRLDDPNGELILTHSWAVEGAQPSFAGVRVAFPYFMPQVRSGKPVILEHSTSSPRRRRQTWQPCRASA